MSPFIYRRPDIPIDIIKSCRKADLSFECKLFAEDIDRLPVPPGLAYDVSTGILLAGKTSVGPHVDPMIGNSRFCSCFYVAYLSPLATHYLYLHVGESAFSLREGDFIVFDDSIMHSLVLCSRGSWAGFSIQLKLVDIDKVGTETDDWIKH